MKVSILRAVSEPAQLFWAPMLPAMLNFLLCSFGGIVYVQIVGGNPLIVFIGMVVMHGVIIGWGVKEPHIATMLEPWSLKQKGTSNFIRSKGNKFVP